MTPGTRLCRSLIRCETPAGARLLSPRDVAVAIDLRLLVSGESSEELMSRPIRALRVLLPYSTITNVAWAATILQPVSAS